MVNTPAYERYRAEPARTEDSGPSLDQKSAYTSSVILPSFDSLILRLKEDLGAAEFLEFFRKTKVSVRDQELNAKSPFAGLESVFQRLSGP